MGARRTQQGLKREGNDRAQDEQRQGPERLIWQNPIKDDQHHNRDVEGQKVQPDGRRCYERHSRLKPILRERRELLGPCNDGSQFFKELEAHRYHRFDFLGDAAGATVPATAMLQAPSMTWPPPSAL